ncbi:MAG: tetratricopeptide repeat protein [Candidatus Sulfotelmatobacter sp.]
MIPLLATVAAQTVPSGRESVGTQPRQGTRDSSQYLARCVEELDLSACKRVGKRGFSPKERSQGFAYEYAAQSAGPVTALDQAIRLDPQNALAYFPRGHITANDQGVGSYLRAIELNPEWKRYYVDVALLADNADSYKSSEQGLQLWQRALESAPDDLRVYAGYGNALEARGRIAAAEAMFQKGLAANPADALSASGLCSLYIKQKNVDKLRSPCRTAVGFSAAPLDSLAFELNQVQEYALAELAYRKALERGSDPQPFLTVNLASTLLQEGKTSEAELVYRKLMERGGDPQHSLMLNLASTLLQEGKASEAAEIYKVHLAKHSSDFWWRDAYASALESTGDFQGAEEQYLEAVDEHPDCSTNGDLGLFYLHRKKYQEALDRFDLAFQDQWDCPTPVFALTQNKQSFGTEQARVTQFEEKILARVRPKEDEKAANTWYRFAQLSHAFGQNDQAAAAYRRAADLSPKQAFPLGGLGWALYEAGRYQEAIAAFEEAEKRQPGYLKSAPEVEKRYQESLAAVKGQKK